MDLETVKNYLKIDSADEDEILQMIIRASTEYVESSLDNETGSSSLKEATLLLFISLLYTNRGIHEGRIDPTMQKLFDGLILKLKTGSKDAGETDENITDG